jgi:hypothetical protein
MQRLVRAALPFPSTPASSPRRLVCPVSVPSCWVYAARLSLGLIEPNGREACEPLSVPRKKREVEFCDRRSDTAASSSCRHTRPRAIGSSQMGARKTLHTASGVLEGGGGRRMSKTWPADEVPMAGIDWTAKSGSSEAYQGRPTIEKVWGTP